MGEEGVGRKEEEGGDEREGGGWRGMEGKRGRRKRVLVLNTCMCY